MPTGPGRAPDFFIVSHPKSGASALLQILAAHPCLHMPRERELWVRFRDEVVALSDYLDRGLVSFWGYDDLD